MKAERNINFTEGPITGPLVRFMLPVLLALFLQSLYGAVDLLVVGQFATSADVSGVSTGSQIMMTLTNIVASFSMGMTILLGQKIGEKRTDECSPVIGAGLVLFLCIGVLLTGLTVIFPGAIASLMNAPEEAMPATVGYIRTCGVGIIVIIAYNLIGSIFRGLGDSRTPLITVAIATVVNIFGDLLLVAVFHMGAVGAAVATVAAQLVSVICSYFMIRRQTLPFTVEPREWKNLRALLPFVKRITGLGLPLAFSDFLVGLSFLIILAIVNSLGLTASAGMGVAEKVCNFIMLVSSAFSQSVAAFVAQNYGAGKPDRCLKALKVGIGLSLACGTAIGLFAYFRGDLLCGIFSREPDVIAHAWDYLKAYAFDAFLTAFLFVFIGFFNGVGMTRFVMLQGIVGAFCVRVPLSFVFSKWEPVSLFHIGLATPCSTVVQIILCFIAMASFRKRKAAVADRLAEVEAKKIPKGD